MMARRRNKATIAPTTTNPAKMGEEMAKVQSVSAQSPNLKYQPRGGAAGGSPEPATANVRSGHQERLGAKWAPQMPLYEQNAAEASQTQRNVRVVQSAVGNRDFWFKRQFGQNMQ